MARARILVADDEPLIVALIERTLGKEYELVCVGDGRKALALLHAGERFDVIVCDLSMPAMGGALLYFEAAVLAPEQAQQFVFVTGGATNSGDQALVDRAQQPTLTKPFTIAELRFVVEGMLGER